MVIGVVDPSELILLKAICFASLTISNPKVLKALRTFRFGASRGNLDIDRDFGLRDINIPRVNHVCQDLVAERIKMKQDR